MIAELPGWTGDLGALAGLVVIVAAAGAIVTRAVRKVGAELVELADARMEQHLAPVRAELEAARAERVQAATLAGALEEQLADVQKELRPNGGRSLRDAVGRIERVQRASTGQLEGATAALYALERRLEAVERRGEQDAELDQLAREGRVERRRPGG